MSAATETELETTVAVRVAGEDIACGDYVAIFNQIYELPSYLWSCAPVALPFDEPVRIRFMATMSGVPHKVIGICLPFVYAKSHCGAVVVFDTRGTHLVKLDRDCARVVWKEMKANSVEPPKN